MTKPETIINITGWKRIQEQQDKKKIKKNKKTVNKGGAINKFTRNN